MLSTPHPSPLPQGEREQETSLYAPAPLSRPGRAGRAPEVASGETLAALEGLGVRVFNAATRLQRSFLTTYWLLGAC
jgi:hypothetical protein